MPEFFLTVAAIYSLTFRSFVIYLFILFSFRSNDNEIKFTAILGKNKESPAHGKSHYVFKGNKTVISFNVQEITFNFFRQGVDTLESGSLLICFLFIFQHV